MKRLAPLLLLLLLAVLPVAADPLILYTDIISGPNAVGENNDGIYLSIFGTGFGTSQGGSTVEINGVEVAAYHQWGVDSRGLDHIDMITVQPGSGVSTGAIEVIVSAVSSNLDHTFTVRSGDIYFVASDGDSGTAIVNDITKPWDAAQDVTFEAGFGAGDTIVVRGGTYGGEGVGGNYLRIDKTGTLADPITVMGYPGETPFVDKPSGRVFRTYNGNGGLIVSNFVGDSGGDMCMNMIGPYNRFVNNEMYGLSGTGGGTGCIVGFSYDSMVYGNSVHDNGETKKYHSIYFSVVSPSAANLDIGWNHVYNVTGGRGIQFYHGVCPVLFTDTLIHDNLIHDTDRHAVSLGECNGTGIKVYNNIIYNTGDAAGQGGVRPNETTLTVEIYNNTFYDNVSSLSLDDWSGLIVKNNIFVALGAQDYFSGLQGCGGAAVISDNVYYGSTTDSTPACDTNPIETDPLLVNPGSGQRTFGSGDDFRLQSGSSADEAGVNTGIVFDFAGIVRPVGTNYDVGAFECCATPPVANMNSKATGCSVTGGSIGQ